VARQAGVGQLVLIHVPPKADDEDLRARALAEHDNVIVGTDGLRLTGL
jgi:ribonuclease BN (tRNA processing enzyme)